MIGEILLASAIMAVGYQFCSGIAEMLAERRQRKADEQYRRENPPSYCQCGHEDYQHLGYRRHKPESKWGYCAMCKCSHFQLRVNVPISAAARPDQIKRVGEAIKRATKLSPRSRFLLGFSIVAVVGHCLQVFAYEQEPITLTGVLACVAAGAFVAWILGRMVWAIKEQFRIQPMPDKVHWIVITLMIAGTLIGFFSGKLGPPS